MKKAMTWCLSILMLIGMAPSALAGYADAAPLSVNDSDESAHLPISAYGIDYEMWSTIYQDGSNTWRGSSWVHTADSVYVPTGYMGVATGLYRPNGAKYVEVAMTYNPTSSTLHFQETKKIAAESVGVICKGEIAVYNGAGYTTALAPSTAVQYPGRSAQAACDYVASVVNTLTASLDQENGYPVTATGKTYGSELLYDVVGARPDLIYAEGVGGTLGYILSSDLEPDIREPEEAAAYTKIQARNPNGYYLIPLYDLNENVIGSFQVLISDGQTSAAAREAYSRIYQQDENAKIVDMLGTDSYSVNSRGETYGSSLLTSVVGVGPDLELVAEPGGQMGYIRERDTIWGQWKDSIQTPQDAIRYMEYRKTMPDEYLIPLYDHEGNVIGEFLYGGSSDSSSQDDTVQAAN